MTSPFISTALYDVLNHTNHIFSESLSSGDDNDRDGYLKKDKDTHTQTNTKCFQDPMYAIFIKSRGFKDLRYYIGCLLLVDKVDMDMVDMDMVDMDMLDMDMVNMDMVDMDMVEYFSEVNIFQG